MSACIMSPFKGWSTFKSMIHSIFMAIWFSRKAGMQHLEIPQRCYNSSCAIQHPAFKANSAVQPLHPHRILTKSIFDKRAVCGVILSWSWIHVIAYIPNGVHNYSAMVVFSIK